MAIIHLNFLKFKHKNGEIQGKKDYLGLSWKNLGFGTIGGHGFWHTKGPVDGWFHSKLGPSSPCVSQAPKPNYHTKNHPNSCFPISPCTTGLSPRNLGQIFLHQIFGILLCNWGWRLLIRGFEMKIFSFVAQGRLGFLRRKWWEFFGQSLASFCYFLQEIFGNNGRLFIGNQEFGKLHKNPWTISTFCKVTLHVAGSWWMRDKVDDN